MTDNLMIEQIIQEMHERTGSNVPIFVSGHHPLGRYIGGKYSLESHSITLYCEEIKRQAKYFFPDENLFPLYAKIILAHEMGHALDPYLKQLSTLHDKAESLLQIKKIELLIEVQAWKYAEKWVKDVPLKLFRFIRQQSLTHYYEEMGRLLDLEAA